MKPSEILHRFTGFDISNKMLKIATDKAEKAGVQIKFVLGDITELIQLHRHRGRILEHLYIEQYKPADG